MNMDFSTTVSCMLFFILPLVYGNCGVLDRWQYQTSDSKWMCIDFIDGNVRIDAEAIFRCAPGYKINGNKPALCHKKWIVASPPKCEAVQCTEPDKIQYGTIQYDNSKQPNTFGSTYIVHCEQGYEPSGSIVRTCSQNGSWSGIPVRCSEIKTRCNDLHLVANGMLQLVTNPNITKSYMDTTVYCVICDGGYSIHGSQLVECGAKGEWISDIPTCEHVPITCPNISHDIGNGKLQAVEQPSTNRVFTVECNDGYTVEGPPVLVCFENGTWSMTTPYCKSVANTYVIFLSIIVVFLAGIIICLVFFIKSSNN